MDLTTYLASAARGTGAELARALGVSPVMVSQWANALKQVPAERCPEIERATGGAVRCEDLRPDVAWDVLVDRPPRPAAPAAAEQGA